MPGLFFLDFCISEGPSCSYLADATAKRLQNGSESLRPYCLLQNLSFWPGAFLSQSPWGLAGGFSSLGLGVCSHPCLQEAEACPGSSAWPWSARVSFFVCLSGWFYSSFSSTAPSPHSSFFSPLLPPWCQVLGVTLISGPRMGVKTRLSALVWNFLEVRIC